jgi:hypothetical protein
MFFHFLLEFGIIPIDLLILTLIFEDQLEIRKSKHRTEKLDILMGTFYSEIGDDLIKIISQQNNLGNNTCQNLNQLSNWKEKDFKKNIKSLEKKPPIFKTNFKSENDKEKFFTEIRIILSKKRLFVADLINNPELFEKEDFSDMLLHILHLDEEINRKKSINLTENDYNHLMNNINRVYSKLIQQWVKYVHYLYKTNPYMMDITIRNNPFDKDCSIHVKK